MLRWLAIGALLGGCSSESTYYCLDDTQCGRDGVCESPGWCSFPDPGCDSGRRFGQHAGADARGECVPVGGIAGSSDSVADDGLPSTSTSAATSNGDPDASVGEMTGNPDGEADDGTESPETTDPTADTCEQGCDESSDGETAGDSTGFIEECAVSIRDDFDDGSLADWILNESPHQASESAGVLRIHAVAGVADDQDVFKVDRAHGRAVLVLNVAEPPPDDVPFQLLFHADLFGVDSSEFYGWSILGGDLLVMGDEVAPLGDVRWLRIRVDDDSIAFDSSSDGESWDEHVAVALPEPATGMGIHLQGQSIVPLSAPETLAFESIDICLR